MKIVNYRTKSGKKPFVKWFESLDIPIQAMIAKRLERVKIGNFGDHKPLKGSKGLKELIFDTGPGYRIYFGIHNTTIVILLGGGIKRSQIRDIEKVHQYWNECMEELNYE